MYARLAIFLCLSLHSIGSLFAQEPGHGAKLWDDICAQYPQDQHYVVMFSYERRSPMTRSAPEKAMMTYSAGKFVAILPEITWYYNGDTLWEYVPSLNELTIRDRPGETALSPSEILEILNRPPVSARHHGTVELEGEICDKIKLDFHGRHLPYVMAYIWVSQSKEMRKIIFVDQWQTATTIVIYSIRKTAAPSPSEFRFSSPD